MRKPILLSALLALFVCPTLASYAGSVDSISQHGTTSDSQNGTMRFTESGLTAASSASFSHAPLYVDMPPAAADPTPEAKPVARQATSADHPIQSDTKNYIWTK